MRKALVLMNADLGFEPELQAELKKIKQVTGAHQVYGVYDIVAEVRVSSMEELKDTVNYEMRKLENVLATNTIIVTDEPKPAGS